MSDLGRGYVVSESGYIQELQDAIRRLHGVESEHLRCVAVKETFQGTTVWDGLVEIFALKNHPKSCRAYAWAHDTGGPQNRRRHVTVLHTGFVNSAQDAVKAAIVQEFKNLRARENQTRRVGRPRLPQGEAKGRIVPVRFKVHDLEVMEAAARASEKSLSEWIRSAIQSAIQP
jgi:hypothetical protein